MPEYSPVNDPHDVAIIQEILAQRITVAGAPMRPGMGGKRLLDRFRGLDHIVVPVGQVDVLGRKNVEIFLDHREQLEPEVEAHPRIGATSPAPFLPAPGDPARLLNKSGVMVAMPPMVRVIMTPDAASAHKHFR